MERDIENILLKQLLKEPLSSDEEKALFLWKNKNEVNNKVFDRLITYWESGNHDYETSMEKVWDNIDQDIKLEIPKPKKFNFRRLYGVAAVITFLISVAYLPFLLNNSNDDSEELTTALIEFSERKNEKGEQRTLRLSDGTIVKLNSESYLKFPKKFWGDTREVYLIGEAFFDVAEDVTKPFIVHSESVSTLVKGTSFNVKANSEAEDVVVSVVTGKVQVSIDSSEKNIFLTPTEQAVVSVEEDMLEKRNFHPDEIAWTEGRIVFKESVMEEIIPTLEQWYGVEIIMNKKIDSRKGFTGSYKRMTLSDVLESISYTYKFKYKIKGKEVTIY